MKLIESLADTFTAVFRPEPLKEVLNPEFAGMVGVDPDEHLFRKLTGATDRDLNPLKYERIANIAYWLYTSNPIAHRLTEITKDFVIGKGITYESEDERVKEVLNLHWNDPVNSWELKQHTRILELGLFGELNMPAFVNEINGQVRLGYIDPLAIAKVVTLPDNIEIIDSIKLKGRGGVAGQSFKVIRENDDGILEGDAFVFQTNKVSNATRGNPDLASLVDWLDAFDDSVFGEVERSKLMRAYVWDYTLEGYDEGEVEKWLKNRKTPKWGSIWAHNEKVSRAAVSPKLESADFGDLMKMILGLILGGSGTPEHWFALAYDINRATATEMDKAVIRRIETRQKFVKGMFRFIFKYQIQQAAIKARALEKGTFPSIEIVKKEKLDEAFQINIPDPSEKNINETAEALKTATEALDLAKRNRFVSDEKAAEIWSMLASEFGVEIDVKKEKVILDKIPQNGQPEKIEEEI